MGSVGSCLPLISRFHLKDRCACDRDRDGSFSLDIHTICLIDCRTEMDTRCVLRFDWRANQWKGLDANVSYRPWHAEASGFSLFNFNFNYSVCSYFEIFTLAKVWKNIQLLFSCRWHILDTVLPLCFAVFKWGKAIKKVLEKEPFYCHIDFVCVSNHPSAS